MVKTYSRIDWENEPSTKTPVNETNLNKMDAALNEIDNRVVSLDTTKASVSDVNGLVASIEFNEKTGVFTVTKKDGSKATFDTKLEKIAVNFEYDPATQKIIIYLDDGTTQEIDLSAFVTQYEFTDGDIVTWSVVGGKVTANIKENSIPGNKLEPNYLANCITAKNEAQTAAGSANASAQRAEDAAERAEAIVGITIATTEKAGIVKPDGKSISVKADGTITANYSNPNLLDNPFFTVNQRNATNANGGFGVDRWFGNYAINADKSIDIGQYALQGVDYPLNAPLTMSAILGDGSIVSGTLTLTDTTSQVYFYVGSNFQLVRTSDNRFMIWTPTTQKVKAVKLELGEVSTLANDVAPNYTKELAKCQRYYRRYNVPFWSGFVNAGGNTLHTDVDTSGMRTIPSVNWTTGGVTIDGGGYRLGITNYITSISAPSGHIQFNINAEGVAALSPFKSHAIGVWFNPNTYVEASADL